MCVTSPCVVHGPIYSRFMGFYVNGFLSIFKGLQDVLKQRPSSLASKNICVDCVAIVGLVNS